VLESRLQCFAACRIAGERVKSYGRIAVPLCVAEECLKSHCRITNARGVAVESKEPTSRVEIAGIIAKQRTLSKGSIVASGSRVEERVRAHSSIASAD
jgi:hypothetical protein